MSSKLVQSRLPCPSCPSSDGYHLYDDGHGFCYSCRYLYLPNASQERSNKENMQEDTNVTYQIVELRGLSKETLQLYDAKTKVGSDGRPISIGFRYPSGWTKVRSLEHKAFHSVGTVTPGLYGRDKFGHSSKYVTITEGELDACSLYQVLRSPCVSVSSATAAVRDCTADLEWLSGFERIYLAFDQDTAGRDALSRVGRLFPYGKVYEVKFTNRKDANEYLQNGEETELKRIWWNSKKYLPYNLVSSLDEFEKILTEEPRIGVPYPWPTLTEMTYGIRKGESVLITAQEGVGKTELLHHIEHQLLTGTDENVGAIYLEEPKDRHLKALAGLTLKRPAHLPDSGCTTADITGALRATVKTDGRLFLYSNFGSDDPSVFIDTIRFLAAACNCGYILFDHYSMVVSGLEKVEHETRVLDRFATQLEMLVQELGFALIGATHVNDENKTRMSRMLGKTADVRISLFRDHLHPDDRVRNTTTLILDKNRFGRKTGFAGRLLFSMATNTYTEEEAATITMSTANSNGSVQEITHANEGEAQEAVRPLVSDGQSSSKISLAVAA